MTEFVTSLVYHATYIIAALDHKDWEGMISLALAASKYQGQQKGHYSQLGGTPRQLSRWLQLRSRPVISFRDEQHGSQAMLLNK